MNQPLPEIERHINTIELLLAEWIEGEKSALKTSGTADHQARYIADVLSPRSP
jgi:hypothetical protein